jgi:GntR family transcriptional regulator
MKWTDGQAIYLQLKEKIISGILDGVFKEGTSIPSVRKVSEDYQINHLTVAKAYQLLVDEGVLEKRRGVGMFVNVGAKKVLKARERKRFLQEEWPVIKEKMQRLGLNWEDLPNE